MSIKTRPNYVHCAYMDTYKGEPATPTHLTWCGRTVHPTMEWAFTNANHALVTGHTGSRLMLCSKCAESISEALRAVAHRPRDRKKKESA